MTVLNKTERVELLEALELEVQAYFDQQASRLAKEANFLKTVKESQTIDASALKSANYDRVKALALYKLFS
tara:strand:+ start:286 stop:498 length:213 start_codon:yes stop_codon:yes gene_type:complete